MPKINKTSFQCRFVPITRRNARRFKKSRNITSNFYFGNNHFVSINNVNINQYNVYVSNNQPPVKRTVPEFKEVSNTEIIKSPTTDLITETNKSVITTDSAGCGVKNNLVILPDSQTTSSELTHGTGRLALGCIYSCTNKLNSIRNDIYSTDKPDIVSYIHDTKEIPFKTTVSDIASKIERMSLRGNKTLDNLYFPMKAQIILDNTPAELLCQLGKMVRSREAKRSRNVFNKINKNTLEFTECALFTEPEIDTIKVISSETSTPKVAQCYDKTPKQLWALSPILSAKESSLETTDNDQNEIINVARSLRYEEENTKLDNSEDIFELTNYFDAYKTETTVENKDTTGHGNMNTTATRKLVQRDALNDQTSDSFWQNSTYRTTRFESFPGSEINETSSGNNTGLRRSNSTGDVKDDDTQKLMKAGNRFTLSENSLNFSSDERSGCTELVESVSLESVCMEHKLRAHKIKCYTKVIPGKKWRRSLLDNKRATLDVYNIDRHSTLCNWTMRLSINPKGYIELDRTLHRKGFRLRDTTEADSSSNLTHDTGIEYNSIIHDTFFDDYDEESDKTLAIHQQVTNLLQSDDQLGPDYNYQNVYGEEKLLDLCCQKTYIDFYAYVKNVKKSKKIGEGVYGEVFSYCNHRKQTILKVIPIEGKRLVNYSPQKTYGEVFSEICVAMSLSNLKNFIDSGNYTEGFCSILNVACLKGKYPDKFIELWDAYDKKIGSENDSPTIFESDQLYIALEMLPGGEPLENYKFCSARQSYSILLQVVHSLAAAEQAFEFEHRDLHWGNVLISKTCNKNAEYIIDGQKYTVKMYGNQATIIDYTLSRIRSGKFDIYNDLEADVAIFQAYGDHQFDIYRDMRSDVKNQWETFVPKTNVRWLHYLAAKCYNEVGYKTTHQIHKTYLRKIRIIKDKILDYSSASDIVRNFPL